MTDGNPPDNRVPDQPVQDPAGDWSTATFDGARREQVRRWSELSLREVITALEEMEQLAARLGGDASPGPTGPARP